MKPKIAPTSPKYALENPVENLYRLSPDSKINQPPTRSRWLPTIFLSVVLGLLAGAAGMVTLNSLYQMNDQWPIWSWLRITSQQKPEREVVIRESGSIERQDQNRQQAYDRVTPTLVSLYRISSAATPADPRRVDQSAVWLGTGVIVTTEGVIALDQEVFNSEAGTIVAVTDQGSVHVIELMSGDSISRLGLAKLEAGSYPIIAFAVSAKLKIGQALYALAANRLAGQPTLSTLNLIDLNRRSTDRVGRVQSSDRLEDYYAALPWSADIESSAVVTDIDGALVGLRFGGHNDSRFFPVDYLRNALKSYENLSAIERPRFGVNYRDLTTEIGLPISITGGRTEGALLTATEDLSQAAIEAGSPAEAANLAADDIIIKINDQIVNRRNSLSRLIQSATVGAELTVRFVRQGVEQDIKVTLGKQ